MSEVETQAPRAGSAAQRVANLLNLAGWLTGIWGIVYPLPHVPCLAILTALPMTGFVLLGFGRQHFTLNGQPRGRATLWGTIQGPAFALGMRALFDDYLVDVTLSLVVAGAMAAVMALFFAVIEGRPTLKSTANVLFFVFAWAWGASVWLNDALDTGQPRTVPVRVLNVTRLTPKTTSFTLYLSAWGPYPDGHMAEVTPAMLRKTRVGDTVCVYIWPGRFGWERYKVAACPL